MPEGQFDTGNQVQALSQAAQTQKPSLRLSLVGSSSTDSCTHCCCPENYLLCESWKENKNTYNCKMTAHLWPLVVSVITACAATLSDCWCCVSLPHTALRSAAASAQGTSGDFWRCYSQFTGGNWEEWMRRVDDERKCIWFGVLKVNTDVPIVFMYSVPHPSCMSVYSEC